MRALALEQIGDEPDEKISCVIAAGAGYYEKTLPVVRKRRKADAAPARAGPIWHLSSPPGAAAVWTST